MKTKHILYITIATLLLIALGCGYYWRNDIHNLFSSKLSDQPTHEPNQGCVWAKTAFPKAGMTAFIQSCPNAPNYSMTFADADGKIIGKWTTNQEYEFIVQVLSKQVSQAPLDVVKEWYAKLTPEEQKTCDIQNADRPLEYFEDGRLMVTEYPHPTAHKTRYSIEVKQEIIKQIVDKSDGIPSGSEYDYLCGHVVGTYFTAHPPYFEFDDRSPGRYVMVGAYGQDTPFIDLNSIRF